MFNARLYWQTVLTRALIASFDNPPPPASDDEMEELLAYFGA